MQSMKEIELKSVITECQMDELSAEEQHLIELAIEATGRSYAPYSHFRVGAAVRLENGAEVIGCNQENAAYPSGLCAERTALFAAGAQYPARTIDMTCFIIVCCPDCGTAQNIDSTCSTGQQTSRSLI